MHTIPAVADLFTWPAQLAKNWFWARDVNGQDRGETETLTVRVEMRLS